MQDSGGLGYHQTAQERNCLLSLYVLDLGGPDLEPGGVYDGAVSSAGAAAHHHQDVLGVLGATANDLVVALALRSL
ncbi:uncharacterized protein METZ01_LOCUS346977, partial [marine metagenome]